MHSYSHHMDNYDSDGALIAFSRPPKQSASILVTLISENAGDVGLALMINTERQKGEANSASNPE